ncbi:MAG: transposase [Anaerolineae bacterium]|nr:transposase [Anaerolineae bacterium]
MTPHLKRYTEEFKRRAVTRVMAAPGEAANIARDLVVPRSTLYDWRKRYAAPLFTPSPLGRRGRGLRAASEGSEE